MRASVITPTALCSWLTACAMTNAGNPNADAPAGATLARSELQRETAPALSTDEREQFGADNRQFAFALYAQVKDENPNVLFSPYSISVALAMTYAGAEGDTEREMADALHFGLPEPKLHAAFNAADLALQGRGEELADGASRRDRFELRMTNASFAQSGRSFEPAYLDVLAQHYGAGMFLADFAGDPERARKAINDWVLERTEQRVEELLPTKSIDPLTALVLVNTIYFKASWLQKFNPTYTQPGTFHAPSGDVTVQMMLGGAEGYARLADYQAISLPYISPAVHMLLILPDEGQLAAVEGRLDDALFQEARAALTSQDANVRLPRFSFDAELRLAPALEALGMVRAFDDADLSGMSGPPGELYISGVYHKAFVAVDEQGTEAGAATAVVVSGRSVPAPPEFIADRPFIFVLYDDPTGQILFVGRLSEPGT